MNGNLVAKIKGIIARTMCLVMNHLACCLFLPIYAAGGTGLLGVYINYGGLDRLK